MSFFKKIEAWFEKVFETAPKWNVVALSALNIVAPIFETVFGLVDPAVARIADPIITQIQTDLGTTSQLLAAGNSSGLTGVLNSIKANFAELLKEAHITDPASVEKANAAEATITSELEAIISAIPSTTTTA